LKKPSKAMQLRWVKILEKAKKELQHKGFVCLAVGSTYTGDMGALTSSDQTKLQQYIMQSLGGCNSVQAWLFKQGVNVNNLNYSSPKMQAYRLAWINQMQDMFSKGEG